MELIDRGYQVVVSSRPFYSQLNVHGVFVFSSGEKAVDVRIPLFVDLSHLHSYHLNTKGNTTVKKILCVLEHSCPDIIYSPMIYSLVSLFLHYMDTSQCFNCIYALLRKKESSFLMTTKVSFEASKLVIRDLAKKYAVSTIFVTIAK